MAHFIILLGGELNVTDEVRTLSQNARVIAADSGIVHAAPLDVVPELWVGDFDSAPEDSFEQYKHVEKLAFERKKDKTDGQIAIEKALERGATQIDLVGAFGGERTDHMLAIMMHMIALHESSVQIRMHSGFEIGWPICGGDELVLDLPLGSMFSIVPLTDLNDISIKGAEYLLDHANLKAFGPPTATCNVVRDRLIVSLRKGRAILIAKPDDFSGV